MPDHELQHNCHRVGHNTGKEHTSECKLSNCWMHTTEGELRSFAACMFHTVSSIVLDDIILTVCLLYSTCLGVEECIPLNLDSVDWS